MEINKNITTVNRTKLTNKVNKYIVIHYVGAVSTAKNNTDYFKSVNRQASANYFVDDTSIWQCVEDKDSAWHCGGGLQGTSGHSFYQKCLNSNSIGVEMCCYKNSKGKLDISDKTIANTIELVKSLMKKYNIPASNVIRHYDVTGKNCPAPFVSDTNRWNDFKSKLTSTATSSTTTKKAYTGTFPKLPLRGYFYYDTKKGKVKDKGTQVKYLQKFLNWAVNAGLAVDGSLGPLCHQAILKYQKTYGLTQDGWFGPKCLAKAKTIKK